MLVVRQGRMVQAGLVNWWLGNEVTNFKMKKSMSKGKVEGQEGVNVIHRPLAMDHLQVYSVSVFITLTISHSRLC